MTECPVEYTPTLGASLTVIISALVHPVSGMPLLRRVLVVDSVTEVCIMRYESSWASHPTRSHPKTPLQTQYVTSSWSSNSGRHSLFTGHSLIAGSIRTYTPVRPF